MNRAPRLARSSFSLPLHFHFSIFRPLQPVSPFFSHSCTLFCIFLHLSTSQPLSFQSLPHSLHEIPGGGGTPLHNDQPFLHTIPNGGLHAIEQDEAAEDHKGARGEDAGLPAGSG